MRPRHGVVEAEHEEEGAAEDEARGQHVAHPVDSLHLETAQHSTDNNSASQIRFLARYAGWEAEWNCGATDHITTHRNFGLDLKRDSMTRYDPSSSSISD